MGLSGVTLVMNQKRLNAIIIASSMSQVTIEQLDFQKKNFLLSDSLIPNIYTNNIR